MSAEFHVRAAQGAAGGDPVPCYVDFTQLPVPESRHLCADHFGVDGPVRLDAILQGDLGESDPQKTRRKRAALLLERAADVLDDFREAYFNGDSPCERFPGAYHPRPHEWANADFLELNVGQYLDHALKLLRWLGHVAFARDCQEKLTSISAALRCVPGRRPDMDEAGFYVWASADLALLRKIEDLCADLRAQVDYVWPRAKTGESAATPILMGDASLGWADLRVEIRSDNYVRMCLGAKERRLNRSELGMEDRRRGDLPNRVWDWLLIFATNDGRISRDTELPPGFKWSRKSLPKSAGEIRKILKQLTGFTDNPIRWRWREGGYVCEFTITDRRGGG